MNTPLTKDDYENIFKKNIKSSVYSVSIKTLFSDRLTRKINYQPYYQRNYVWDIPKATFFIESILLGTDIPPLIFFNTGKQVEVIDGRQRYETIKRFKQGDFKLKLEGLTKLTQLTGYNFSKLDPDVKDTFEDAKIRIFEFEIVNEPRLDPYIEDQIKKEIFRRYNSGITPLNTAEIDNATYDDDEVTNSLKNLLDENKGIAQDISKYFIQKKTGDLDIISADSLQFLRKFMVLTSFPISAYARGSNRSEILDLLYNVKSNNTEDPSSLCLDLIEAITITNNFVKLLHSKIDLNNKLLNECLLWAFSILKDDEVNLDILFTETSVIDACIYFKEHSMDFEQENSHHYSAIMGRFKSVARFFTDILGFDFTDYIKADEFNDKVKELRQSEKEAKLKLEELASLRVQKPEPSLIPVDELVNELDSHRYQVRPSYQRQEKINVHKASAIIESILLGINLPPIFIYKNDKNVREVIDGQQRLLSIIGFLGKKYKDEHGRHVYPKNLNYKLKRLRILKEFNNLSFNDLEFNIRDKILDFRISVIEIDYALNKNFDPVDLFIRLNNKPYPIKDNSFEMWNSFMDREVIERVKSLTSSYVDWFFIKQRTDNSDRMQNEEMITLLAYINYLSLYEHDSNPLGYYLSQGRIISRISEKKAVTNLLDRMSKDIDLKNKFMSSLINVNIYISLLKEKLDSADLKASLNELFNKPKRYLVDFYMLFQIFQRLNIEQIQNLEFDQLKEILESIQSELKKPSKKDPTVSYVEHFDEYINNLVDQKVD